MTNFSLVPLNIFQLDASYNRTFLIDLKQVALGLSMHPICIVLNLQLILLVQQFRDLLRFFFCHHFSSTTKE